MSDTPRELTARQRLFVAEYLKDLNATQAAIRAGYAPKSAEVEGSRLLRNAKVLELVEAGKKAQLNRVELSADHILRELMTVGLCDIRQAFKEDGTLKPIHEIPEEVARAISSVEVDEIFEMSGGERIWTGNTRKVKFWDKVRSLELLGKHLKMWVDRVEHDVSDGLAERLKASRERANSRKPGGEA